jgi:hypothetical protein
MAAESSIQLTKASSSVWEGTFTCKEEEKKA